MLKSLALICGFCCWLGVAPRTVSAQTPSAAGGACTAAMLDVSALPGPPSFSYGGHVFVLELQNISPAACSLQAPLVALAPVSDTNNQPFYAVWRSGDSGEDTHEFEPHTLEPGGWAHLLFVWTSRVAPEMSCNLYSEARVGFSYQWPQRGDPEIDIRNLWIRACGPFGVSGYRLGRYTDASRAPQKWLDWYGPAGSKDFDFPAFATPEQIGAPSALLQLSAKAKRVMLGDRLFSLRLNFPRLAAQGCAFSHLKKRESDGSTVILMQQCDDFASDKSAGTLAVPRYHESGVIQLYMGHGNLELAPDHPGPLAYEIVGPVERSAGKKDRIQYARTRAELVARDPALPRQAAVLDPLPACTPAQLRVDSPVPIVSTPLRTLRAYNATNISPEACSLAGAPRTRGLDEDDRYQHVLPPACPNCENELFMPRPNGRIDLKQGETAHLLAGATGDNRGAGFCTRTTKFEFSLNRDAGIHEPVNTGPLPEDESQSVTVPFGGEDCVALDISAWRQGAYDGDPLNLREAAPAQDGGGAPQAPIPAECNRAELLAHGRPLLIDGAHDPAYGLSMTQHEFVRDEAVPVYLWTNNSSDHAIEIGGCTEPGYFRAGGFVLYDAYGHRILNKRQIASDKECKAHPDGYYNPPVCTATVSFSLAAHTCMSNPVDLAREYDLPPGEYTISTRDPGDGASCPRRGERPHPWDPATDIGFKVLQP